ncbi:phytanoyl-CoA dioxygenase family protein [Methylibium sp.]|uniref:phytanoyl-CoA dioxygenase family protein n=1 Tax=Methylibium sp. TaxID=2067992 RepID=UPI0017F9A8D2|nr:phytanoyl-CoA dioxygenase family protein [Methylibium sp.]MBA3589997.1 phytanoyl-CoA dioxygenase family protein [Methylibium sp.]
MKSLDIDAHTESVMARGYTVIPGQVSASEIASLNAAADRALEKFSRVVAAGIKPTHTQLNPYVRSARCFYTWDASSRELLGHDTIHALAQAVLGRPRLWDMTVLEALPMPTEAELGPFNWHRDFSASCKDERHGYLWIFTCLTDVTKNNGATWVIPGSHRDTSLVPPSQTNVSGAKPSNAVQLTAQAGDIVAINPAMFHCVGENRTGSGRRLALVGMCRMDRPPLLDHWSIAGPALQKQLPDRVRKLLRATYGAADASFDVLPDGWTVAKSSGVERAFRRVWRRAGAVLSKPGRVLRLGGGATHP